MYGLQVRSYIEGGMEDCNGKVSGLHCNLQPHIPEALYKVMNDAQRNSCFGLGSKRAGKESSMFRALSEADARRWASAFESLESEDSVRRAPCPKSWP